MRTIVQISDLHFGRTECRLVEAIIETVRRLEPNVVAVSGDLTQRARTSEFREARDFLDALPRPQIVIPGNHDIPFFNLYGRFVEGLHRFRRHIGDEMAPFYSDAELAVAGINTARALTFKHGRVNPEALRTLRERMRHVPEETVKILVAHHPLDLPHVWRERPVGRAWLAAEALKECRFDIVLAGHLHRTHCACPTERLRVGGHTALLIQAGTAVSTRVRGEPNAFNALRTSAERIVVEQYAWSDGDSSFRPTRALAYRRSATGLVAEAQVPAPS